MIWLSLLVLSVIVALCLVQRRRLADLRTQLEHANADLQRVQASCALLAPAGIVERVISDGVDSAAERKVVTAMFIDLVGYTRLSEELEPAAMTRLLNGYFQRVSDAVTAHRGRISTFLGDGVLAYFGAFDPNPWQCNDAVEAALALRGAMVEYNDALKSDGLPRAAIGIGIHRGPGLCGLIGSRERREFTVIGGTTNLAARVQALTRTHDTDILLTAAVREELDPRFQLKEMPATPVKGIDLPVVTYALEK